MTPAPEPRDPKGIPHTSDEDLARLAQDSTGEAARAAFGDLVRRYEASLFGFLFVRVGNASTAEELVQEAFLRAWSKLQLFDPKQRFSTWLYTLAKNLAVSRARIRSLGTVPDEILVNMAGDSDPTLQLSHDEELEGLWALAKELLNDESCSAMWLRYHEGLSHREIASILERRAVSVRVMLFRAREVLIKALEEQQQARRPPAPRALKSGI